MKNSSDTHVPSPKVGLVLILVVLIIVLTIFGSKFTFKKDIPVKDLENVELVVERKTGDDFKTGDTDLDSLPDWLEEFYKSDPNNPDTDGDGTKDGEEITLKRDPSIAGPNDALIAYKDLFKNKADTSDFTPGTLTDKASVDLFSEYLLLKKKGILKPEDETVLVNKISQNVVKEASLKNIYTKDMLNSVPSNKQSITAYGERYAQIALSAYTQMNTYKNYADVAYFKQLSLEYKKFSEEVLAMSVPDVFVDVHLPLVNQLSKTSVFFETMAQTDSDPLTSIVILAQYQAAEVGERDVYITLANYFKNNDILFDIESTKNFWKQFEN